MNHPINQMQFSDDSSDYDHPNIEKGTLKRLVREKKEREKSEKMKELEHIKAQLAENYTPELEQRRVFLEESLKPKLIETSTYTIDNKQIEEDDPTDIYTEQLLFLGSEPTIENFINFVENNKKIDLNEFGEYLYLNLAENIKDGYEEAAIVICKLIIFFRHMKDGGLPLLRTMKKTFEDDQRRILFENECLEYFKDTKMAMQKLKDERQ